MIVSDKNGFPIVAPLKGDNNNVIVRNSYQEEGELRKEIRKTQEEIMRNFHRSAATN